MMPCVVADACCIINLYAADPTFRLAGSIDFDLYVPSSVAREVLYVRARDQQDPSGLVPKEIDLAPAISQGFLRRCDVDGQTEAAFFVQLAYTLDDGEAACLAIGKHRGWTLATDDRKASAVAGELGVSTITTPELVKRWADIVQASDTEVAEILQNIEIFARFSPRRGSPLYTWWTGRTSKK